MLKFCKLGIRIYKISKLPISLCISTLFLFCIGEWTRYGDPHRNRRVLLVFLEALIYGVLMV